MAIITSVSMSIVFAVGILYMVKRYLQDKHALPLPPGSAGIPFLGNVNDMPRPGVPECHHWLQHKDLYGPISSVNMREILRTGRLPGKTSRAIVKVSAG